VGFLSLSSPLLLTVWPGHQTCWVILCCVSDWCERQAFSSSSSMRGWWCLHLVVESCLEFCENACDGLGS
jgi:hypothetical protein